MQLLVVWAVALPLEEIFSNTFSAYFDAKNKVDFSNSFSRGMVLNHFFDNQFSLLQSKLYHREKVKISSDTQPWNLGP